MAGIEHLEVHSRSYIVRWVQVDEGNTVSWSVQPHKKSINFGIVKHPGNGATALHSASSVGDVPDGASRTHGESEGKTSRIPKRDSTAQDLLAKKGFISVKWLGKCEADKVSMGTHDVGVGDGGMYGLVFDNTFSKQTSKTATFVVLTYPTDAPPQTVNHLPNLQLPNSTQSQTSLAKYVPNLEGGASQSSDSLHSHGGRPKSVSGRSEGGSAPTNYHVGTLSKRRRKKGQGYARRFFSLDYSTCTLSYYYNRNSSALRGAIPLSLAAVAADERRREISIDSGAEVWHLRAPNSKEFEEWAKALERASRLARGIEAMPQRHNRASMMKLDTRVPRGPASTSQDEENEWHQVETLVSRVVGTRDALRRLTKDITAPACPPSGQFLSPSASGAVDERSDGYFTPPEKRPFWRRKSSAATTTSALAQQAVGPAMAMPSPGSANASMNGARVTKGKPKGSKGQGQEERSVEDHCQALLTDLDSVVLEFTTLINNSKRRRMQAPLSAGGASRKSIETVSTADEFFDAEDAKSGVVKVRDSEDDEGSDAEDENDNSSVSSGEGDEMTAMGDAGLFPAKPKSLIPLPIEKRMQRRTSIPQATVMPPSLIAFVRKNVGKDLSTITMPVSANEPISVLQKVAEQLEYAELLDQAVKQKTPTERLLYVTAFAVSQFSSSRVKERAIRKPFTPLLGETFELLRTEHEVPGGFRLLVEKVSHRPLRLAMHADSANWSFAQSPAPGNKFWGKSAEITMEGRVRVALRLPDGNDELYSWNVGTMFLRNVVMGEKYVEPVGTMHVVNDSTGHKATVEFKGKGMFGGRIEDVNVTTFSPDGSNTGSGLVGTWTSGLRTQGPGKAASDEIWQVGPLVQNAPQTYGLTEFAAGLNEITSIEKDHMAPTDCRLRPDQRRAEEGDLDEAESLKLQLEEAQRTRRKEMEVRGEEHQPRWFVRADNAPDGEEVWKIKSGKDSYWEERARGSWTGVQDLFNV
ncbi:putative oxysterol binding protein [Emericellopsis atlantica]|uniref:Oxysterol binding protein n=1 Tax=Emericellopsis atlantica TaxID=2614577 RepID=A0A9P7ZEY3_9HYPO|nr:putative oxysterol binding protein [Emericellopsis atlantica]KAG9250461.1 putative oxysterol binding protein [Emericellopsis atlantica]